MFSSLELENFRGFQRLNLADLKRVNLIVGRNNAGKTSLLESIILLADPEKVQAMPRLLRPADGDAAQRYFPWLLRDASGVNSGSVANGGERRVEIQRNSGKKPHSPAGNRVLYQGNVWITAPAVQPERFRIVSVQPRPTAELVSLFAAAIARRGGEETMDAIFRELDDRIRKVRIIPLPDGLQIMFDFNLSEMVPLSQVGQGIHRLITIFSELLSTDFDICIIDEIENGIHHTMLEQVWEGIAAAATRLNIQVFATTHSHECIAAAHAAFAKREVYDFDVIQLFRIESGIQGRVLDRKHIEAAMAGEIDLR